MKTTNRPRGPRFYPVGETAAPKKKPWWKSRTLWTNASMAALTALEGVTGWLQPYLPVNFYVAMAVALPIVNAILRAITTQPLRFYNPQQEDA